VSKGQPFNAAKPLHRFKLPLSDKGQQLPMAAPGAREEMAGIAIRNISNQKEVERDAHSSASFLMNIGQPPACFCNRQIGRPRVFSAI
jgi:hypothetical protein